MDTGGYSPRDRHWRPSHAASLAQRSATYNTGPRSEESWIEISSQPSSSSLSSVADEIITTGLRVEEGPNARRKRRARPGVPSRLNMTSRAPSVGATSSQEEYEESDSEPDRVMTSSNEGLHVVDAKHDDAFSPAPQSTASDDEDENRTAVNYPINNEHCFTPQPNAFSHPTSARQHAHSVPGSYFPGPDRPPNRPHSRFSYPPRAEACYNAAIDHEAALRASLNNLISLAGAARGLSKSSPQQQQQQQEQHQQHSPRQASDRVRPSTLRMVPESALREEQSTPPVRSVDEPAFKPTIRRWSTSTSASVDKKPVLKQEAKRKPSGSGRASSKDRRAVKKARRSSSAAHCDELLVSPTLLTWVVSAGVVVVLSALSFSAGYAYGKEAGKIEVSMAGAGEAGSCAKEAGRTGLGLRKLRFSSVARSVGVGA